MLEISSFYTCVPKITIIWYMVPEIQSEADRNFCHFGPFFALSPPWQPGKSKLLKNENTTWRYYQLTHVHHKWQSHNVWFLSYRAQQTEFFTILDHFLHFYPPNNPKNQNLEKMKNKHLEISSSYTSVPNVMTTWCTVSEIWCVTDGWTNGKSDIERWVSHLEKISTRKSLQDKTKNISWRFLELYVHIPLTISGSPMF